MRADIALYVLAIICIVSSAVLGASYYEEYMYYAVTLFIIGVIFAVAGYIMKPKPATAEVKAEPAKIEAPPKEEALVSTPAEPETVSVTEERSMELTEIRGIGPKRAKQLEKAGISSAKDLANMSAEELSSKTGVSPKTAQKWIERARKAIEKT